MHAEDTVTEDAEGSERSHVGMTYADNWRLRSHCVTFAWHTTCSFDVASVVTSLAFVLRLLCDTQHYLRVHTVSGGLYTAYFTP